MSGKLGAVAAAITVLLGGFAAVRLFSGGDEPAPPAPVENNDPGDAPVDPGTENEQSDPVTEGGGLQDLIVDTVGGASLTDVAQNPELIANWGANDGYSMTYAAADGTELIHNIAAFSSAEDADASGAGVAEGLQEAGYALVGDAPVEIDGETVGTKLMFEGSDAVLVLWSNGVLLASVQGLEPATVDDFYANLPY